MSFNASSPLSYQAKSHRGSDDGGREKREKSFHGINQTFVFRRFERVDDANKKKVEKPI